MTDQKFNDRKWVISFVIFSRGGQELKNACIHYLLGIGNLGEENSFVLLITNVLQLEEVLAEPNSLKKDLSYRRFIDMPTSGFTAGEKVQAV